MSRLYLAAIVVYIGIFTASIGYGWSSAALELYKQKDTPAILTVAEGGWIASLFMAGCAVGPIITYLLSDLVGRKNLLLIATAPWMIGWISIAFATKVWVLCVARFISGMGTGCAFSVTPMYLGEISPAKIRGILLTIIMTSSRFGLLYDYVLIPFVSIKMSSLISTSLVVFFVLLFSWLPESPYYLLRRGKRSKASEALTQLRGLSETDVDKELNMIETSIKNEIENNNHHPLRIIFQLTYFKSLIIGMALGLFQQLSGSQAIMMYTQQIFDSMNIGLEGKYLAMILGVIQILSTIFCAVVVDRYGRRPLLLVSTIGSFFSTGMIATYFNLQWIDMASNITGLGWLPVFGCMFYVIFYSLGLGPLPITIIGEIFPTNIKPICCAIVVFLSNGAGFMVGKTYQMVSESVGDHIAFWMFTILNIIAIIFVYFCVPETKGKTLQQIQKELHVNIK